MTARGGSRWAIAATWVAAVALLVGAFLGAVLPHHGHDTALDGHCVACQALDRAAAPELQTHVEWPILEGSLLEVAPIPTPEGRRRPRSYPDRGPPAA